MVRRKNKVCVVCGKEYEYCNRCKADANQPTWKAIYDNENCRKIMNVATEFVAGHIDKDEAKKELDTCDLSGKKNFAPTVAKAVNDIYATKKADTVVKKDVANVQVKQKAVTDSDKTKVLKSSVDEK